MGKWIDRAALTALTASGLYLLFLHAFDSVLASCCMTFLCCALLFHARRGRGEKYRMSRLQAQAVLENWAYGSDDEARAQLQALLNGRSGELVYLPKHPTSSISMGDVFSAWKNHRAAPRLILSAPCHADGRARTFAATLREPSVEIVDAGKLIPLIRRSNLAAPHAPRGRHLFMRIRDSLAALPGRRPWHRNLLTGLALMLLYMVTGSAAYLALSIGALFISGVSLRLRA